MRERCTTNSEQQGEVTTSGRGPRAPWKASSQYLEMSQESPCSWSGRPWNSPGGSCTQLAASGARRHVAESCCGERGSLEVWHAVSQRGRAPQAARQLDRLQIAQVYSSLRVSYDRDCQWV